MLATIRDDVVGRLCKKDEIILMVGERLYEKIKRKTDKAMEVRKSVCNDMRKLGNLYLHFKSQDGVVSQNNNILDMFMRCNFINLKQAIENYTEKENAKIKAGLKHVLYYLLTSTAHIIKGTFLMKDEDHKADQIDKFLSMFKLWKNHIFGDAQYQLNKARQRHLRKPSELPLEKDVAKVLKIAQNLNTPCL